MDEKMANLNNQLKDVSEKIHSVTREKRNLVRQEDELHLLFLEKERLFRDLKLSWRYGEMNAIVDDIHTELKHHQRNVTQSIEDEMLSLNKKTGWLEEKESNLRHEVRLLAMDKNDKQNN